MKALGHSNVHQVAYEDLDNQAQELNTKLRGGTALISTDYVVQKRSIHGSECVSDQRGEINGQARAILMEINEEAAVAGGRTRHSKAHVSDASGANSAMQSATVDEQHNAYAMNQSLVGRAKQSATIEQTS